MMVSSDNATANLIRNLMLETDYGALTNIFVITAIRWYSKEMLRADSEALREFNATASHWIASENWIGIAREILEKLDTHQYRH